MSPAPTRQPQPTASSSASGDDFRGDLKLLTWQVTDLNKKFDELRSDLRDKYATKDELKVVSAEVVKINGNITWLLRLVMGLVIAAVVGLVIMKGGGAR